MAIQLETYYDWCHLLKAVLKLAVSLNWWSAYDDQVEAQVSLNLQYGLNITLGMFTGKGQYIDPVLQFIIGQYTYF